jgi:Protein of unknown function (DUF433)
VPDCGWRDVVSIQEALRRALSMNIDIRNQSIPVEMILVYLRAGCSRGEIVSDYPRLAPDGIEAVIARVEDNLEPNWREHTVEA